ncbi:MAG: hypothetical protein ABIJ14_03725 [Nanoarchaeota archaeon]|nr:hypothetical protein [Nanoarchaeota archaeon]
MKKEDISFLKQMAEASEEAILNLEESYVKKDYENFDRAKKIILEIQNKISEVAK